MSIIKNSRLTPKGTPPQPKRRATSHKQPSFGQELMARAVRRRFNRELEQKRLKAIASSTEFSKLKPADQNVIKARLAKRPIRASKPTQGGALAR